MSNLLEIKDQVFPGSTFHLIYHHASTNLARNWAGPFYKVADQSAEKIVTSEQSRSPLSRFFVPIMHGAAIPDLELLEMNDATQRYEPLKSVPTESDLEKAQRLFFAGAPTQAWLLMVSGLVRPKELGITPADAKIAILAKHRDTVNN